jgi:hypothetical protein
MALLDDRILEYVEETESGSPKEMTEKGRIRYLPDISAKGVWSWLEGSSSQI